MQEKGNNAEQAACSAAISFASKQIADHFL
jgi:hypothetical protein